MGKDITNQGIAITTTGSYDGDGLYEEEEDSIKREEETWGVLAKCGCVMGERAYLVQKNQPALTFLVPERSMIIMSDTCQEARK